MTTDQDANVAARGRDHAVTEFLRAMPEERRAELRARVRAARQKETGRFPELPPRPDAALLRTDRDHDAAPGAVESVRTTQPGGPPRSLSAPPPPGSRILRLSDVAPERLRWLSRGRLAAGKITVLDGDPGLGKSTLLCELAARITRGDALPGGEAGEPRTVVLMSAEDDLHDTIRPRIDAAGGDPWRVVSLVTLPDRAQAGRLFVIPGDVWLLEEVIARVDAALVIIDPLVAFLDRALSANNDQDVRRALAALKEVGERTGAAIVVVRHLNKSAGTNPLYRGGGSIGIIGAARCGLVVARDPDDPERRVLAATKGNLARPPPARGPRRRRGAGRLGGGEHLDGERPSPHRRGARRGGLHPRRSADLAARGTRQRTAPGERRVGRRRRAGHQRHHAQAGATGRGHHGAQATRPPGRLGVGVAVYELGRGSR